jgi:translocation and assembly module TamB
MLDDALVPVKTSQPKRLWQRWLGVVTLVCLVPPALITAFWLGRKPISKALLSDYLAAKGIAITYDLTEFDHNRLIMRNVVAGSVGNPDFTAKQIVLEYELGFIPKLKRVYLERARLQAQVDAQGNWSIGALDALRPAPSDEPLELPDIALDLTDSALNLVTPYGIMAGRVEARGVLSERAFLKIQLKSGQLLQNTQSFDQVDLGLIAHAKGKQINYTLTARAAQARIQDINIKALVLDVHGATSLAFRATTFNAVAQVGALAARYQPRQTVQAQGGQLYATGKAQRQGQWLQLNSQWRTNLQALTISQGRVGALDVSGDLKIKSHTVEGTTYGGQAKFSLAKVQASVPSALTMLEPLSGTPLAPLGMRLGQNIQQTVRAFDVMGTLSFAPQRLALHDLSLKSAQGLSFSLNDAPLVWQKGRLSLDSTKLQLKGQGLPNFLASITLEPWQPGQQFSLKARIDPVNWQLGSAGLYTSALEMRYQAGRISTQGQVSLSGAFATPQAPVFVERLRLPVHTTLRLKPNLRIDVPRGCLPLQAEQVQAQNLRIERVRLKICQAQRGAFLQLSHRQEPLGRWQISDMQLAGKMGTTALPFQWQSRHMGLSMSAGGRLGMLVESGQLSARLAPEREITLSLPSMSIQMAEKAGSLQAEGLSLEDPQLSVGLTQAQLTAVLAANGSIDLRSASVRIVDKQPAARFEPLVLTKAHGNVTDTVLSAQAVLQLASTQQDLGTLSARYHFKTAQGEAQLRVRDLAFTPELELFKLTELARGVVENVRGLVDVDIDAKLGETLSTTGRVVLRDLSFATAALGPVSGVSGTLHFNDMIGFTTPPGQQITIASLNPGIAINSGVVRLQFLSPSQVRIEEAQWPLAGGVLFMQPSILEPQAEVRRLTFRVRDIDIAQFIQQLDFKNLNATGRMEGVFPLIFSQTGSRIEGGVLRAQPGGGTIQYVGSLSNETSGASQLAFDALRSFRYDTIEIDVNGDLAGEIITAIRFVGVNQAPLKPLSGGVAGIPVRAEGLPFLFNLRIQAPFRSLLGTADRVTNPTKLLNQATPIDPGQIPGSARPLPD